MAERSIKSAFTINACDVPWVDMCMAFRVIHREKSDKQPLCMYDEPTNVREVNGQQVPKLCHPPDALALCVSGSIASLMPCLKCRMHVPASDRNRMILRNISSYVSNPARSLETKSFSVEYWKWQHRFQLETVEQYGPLSLILTTSPYEWTWPCHLGLLA